MRNAVFIHALVDLQHISPVLRQEPSIYCTVEIIFIITRARQLLPVIGFRFHFNIYKVNQPVVIKIRCIYTHRSGRHMCKTLAGYFFKRAVMLVEITKIALGKIACTINIRPTIVVHIADHHT